MKKFTFVLAVMLIASFAFAQKGFLPRVYTLEKAPEIHKATQVQHNTKEPGDIIWSEDFDEAVWGATSSNGNPVPSNAPDGYTLVDDTDNGFFWRWSDVGPRGRYSGGCEIPATNPLESTTGANGFLMMEADWYNTNDECEMIDPPVSHDSYVEYGSIDMSANANVLLVFEQMSRFCCAYSATANSFFEISVDGGSTWEQIDVSPTDINAGAANPTITEVDLTTIAGGQSNVMFRFHLMGLSHYHWEIDDVKFVEPWEYDVRLTDYWNDYLFDMMNDPDYSDWDRDTYLFYGGFYNQPWFLMQPYVNYKGDVSNFGSVDRTNVVYNVDVYRDGEYIFGVSSDPMSMTAGINDTIEVNFANADASNLDPLSDELLSDTAWKTFRKGMYETVLYPSADNEEQRTDNDTLKRQFMIGDSAISYARMDTASLKGGMDPSNWTDYQGDGDGLGFYMILPEPSVYDAENAAPYFKLSSVTAFIPDQYDEALAIMEAGEAQLIAKMYKWDADNEEWTSFISSSPVTIYPEDTMTFVTIPFILDGFSEYLYSGGDYKVCVEFYGTYTTDRLHTFEIGEDIYGDNPRKNGNPWSLQLWLAGDWGHSNGTPGLAVNMSFSTDYPIVGINNTAMQNVDFEVYPNPTNGQFTIDVAGKAKVTIINAIGSVVDSFEITGKQTVNSDLQAGVYFVRVNANGQIGTKQIVVE